MIGLTPRQLEVAQVLAELGPGATLAAIGAELEMGRSAALAQPPAAADQVKEILAAVAFTILVGELFAAFFVVLP